MKDRITNAMQSFGRAIIQPVMFMAVTGLLISIGAIFQMESMPAALQNFGNGLFGVLTDGVIGQLSVIFCIGIATAMAKKNKKTDAAVVSIMVYMVFLYTNNFWLDFTNKLVNVGEEDLIGTGQNMVLGVQVTDMGVFLGILLGVLVGVFINKYGEIKFNKYLAPYEGTKASYFLLLVVTAILAILVTYIWPWINSGIDSIVVILSSMGAFGFFLYGFLNRMLLPFGMHHLLYMPLFWTPLGGTAEIAGKSYSGAMNIWLAEIGNISSVNSIDPSIGYIVNFGYVALPIGIALAFIKTAKPQNKEKVKAIVIPTIIAAALGGITEPIEFLFLFISPLLWVVHGVVYGLGLFISNIAGLNVVVDNLVKTIMYSITVPMSMGRQWLIIPIGVLLVGIEYFAFKFLIVKLKIPTIGREEQLEESSSTDVQTDEESKKDVTQDEQLDLIISGLGGQKNIKDINNCYTRLRIDVKDTSKIDMEDLKKYPSSGVVNKGKQVQIIIGMGVQEVRDNLETYISSMGGT
ncbi:PTS transporter subunit EIIC [Tetragenococcus halophilus]|uniref:PTS transporter subunit EIIC n=1 Tax=Tetragenococcus halophilus TaxID=51669 RepID=A0AB35HNY3_TETHA|nr:PTS transporter subunit EIIC [Tetragenococcus halophilus]MCO8297460.1 PTS transporter subunit EIIC [Tetragenococcus halophilus]